MAEYLTGLSKDYPWFNWHLFFLEAWTLSSHQMARVGGGDGGTHCGLLRSRGRWGALLHVVPMVSAVSQVAYNESCTTESLVFLLDCPGLGPTDLQIASRGKLRHCGQG